MSLYHETAAVLDLPASSGGSLKTRVFSRKDLKSSPAQVYALAIESSKWSAILKEVVDQSQLLQHEKKLTPILSLLLVHDFLLSKKGIALPSSHGLRIPIERHKARLASEFTRARVRRKCPTVDALREYVEATYSPDRAHPRWIRINTLRTTLDDELSTTFKGCRKVGSVQEALQGPGIALYVDENVPNLVAVSPRFDFLKAAAYKSGAIILQDKASCFPAYLLDPHPEDGDIIDSCAAPGNKTTHLAAISRSHLADPESPEQRIVAFEKDPIRARTLQKMVALAGSDSFTQVNKGADFLRVDPTAEAYGNVGALLLDPSCSGSGIVGRDDAPELHLPDAGSGPGSKAAGHAGAKVTGKRKRDKKDTAGDERVLVDDDGNTTVLSSEKDLRARLEALSTFQLALLLHAFKFPSARRITYSTCSVHAEENEQVVLQALQSDVAKQRGWRVLPRARQVPGMRDWPVRGTAEAAGGDAEVADACIRAYKDDGRGVMGFFVAALCRGGAVGAEGASTSANTGAGTITNHTTAGNRSIGHREGCDPATDGGGDAGSEWGGFDD